MNVTSAELIGPLLPRLELAVSARFQIAKTAFDAGFLPSELIHDYSVRLKKILPARFFKVLEKKIGKHFPVYTTIHVGAVMLKLEIVGRQRCENFPYHCRQERCLLCLTDRHPKLSDCSGLTAGR